MQSKLIELARKFAIQEDIESVNPLGEGFINDTFIINTVGAAPNYLLQKKNKNIFKNIPGMMDNIEKVSAHLKNKIKKSNGNPEREAMTIIRTRNDNNYYLDDEGEYWTVALFIEDHIIYDTAETPELAYAGGKGIGKFQSMLADFEGELVDTLPGFHNIRFRFEQWDEALKQDLAGRKKELSEEISWIESRRKEMLEFWKLVENGTIPKRITHNDTKLSNILFDKNGDVLCVIDLDTVLSSIVLNDFGDAIRSYTNTGNEDDENLDNVNMNLNTFKAYAEGYLSEAKAFLTPVEIEYLAFSAKLITYEQVLRFLMDYIDGDKYYKTNSQNHNLMRARAQYKLLQSIEDQLIIMKEFVSSIAS